MTLGPIALALQITELLDRLGIPYALGGSLASSLLGEPRATADVDLAVRMERADLERLIEALGSGFYVSSEAALDALQRRSSFNLVHLESMQKVDLFVLGERPLDLRQLQRRRRMAVTDSPRQELWVTAAEDQVLRKLQWYRAGGGISDRQWRDVVAILSVQRERIDRGDLEGAAAALGLSELLARALREAEVG